MRKLGLCCVSGGLLVSASAVAHVGFADVTVEAGRVHMRHLIVGEGCGDEATSEVRLEVPNRFRFFRPIAMAGWTISEGPGARDQSVTRIVWHSAEPIPADRVVALPVVFMTETGAGPLYLSSVQYCGEESVAWSEIPTDTQSYDRLARPAPMLEVVTRSTAQSPRHDHPH